VAEHVLRNHIHAFQVTNGGLGHSVFTTLRSGEDKFYYGGMTNAVSDAYWCCCMHGAQILAELPRWGVVVDADKIMVTLLAECRATVRPKGSSCDIVVTAARSGREGWKVSLEAAKRTEATLWIRLPEWAETARVESGETPEIQGGWIKLTHAWSGTWRVDIGLPSGIRQAGVYRPNVEPGKPVRLFDGCDLYCLPDPYVVDGLLPDDAVPTIAMAAAQAVDGKIPVVIEAPGGKTQSAQLVPMEVRPRGGARWLLNVRKVDQATFAELASSATPMPVLGTPVELEFGAEGAYELYLNGKRVGGGNGCGECPQVDTYSDRARSVLAVKVRSKASLPALIGMIRVKGRSYVTQADGWSVVRAPDKIPSDWLTDTKKGPEQSAKVVDLGPFGIPPWKHIAAEFLNSKTRWIWAEDSQKNKQGWWLFRYEFDVPVGGPSK
jgi:hypothetical protein